MTDATHKSGRGRRGYVPEPPPEPMQCAHPDCAEGGLYRAPKSRDRLNDYVWFCLDHVREYNQAWDYFSGMNQGEIERHVREDVVGGRPTWPLGQWGSGGANQKSGRNGNFRFHSDFFPEDLAEALSEKHAKKPRSEADRRLTREAKALAILDLKPPVTLQEVKDRYKALAKKLHPDANGGDKSAEERLKVVNQAYSTLKAAALG
jgi:curved DNA-binding protein CbpA